MSDNPDNISDTEEKDNSNKTKSDATNWLVWIINHGTGAIIIVGPKDFQLKRKVGSG